MNPEPENRMTLLSMDPFAVTDETSLLAAAHYEGLSEALFADARQSLAGNRVVVVGGGLIGLMSALYLTRAGAAVTVFEAQSLAAAASGRNGGGIYAFGRAMEEVALARTSMDLWEQLTAEGIDTKFTRVGHAIVAVSDHEHTILQRAARHYALAQLPAELLSPEETSALLPGVTEDNRGALFGTTDGQGYPFSTVTSLLAELRATGAQIHDHSPVTDIVLRAGRAVGVRSSLGLTEADHVILCVGPWVSRFSEAAGLELAVRPRRSQIMVTERVQGMERLPFISGNRVYARRTHAGNLMVGGGGPWEEYGYNVSSSSEALAFLGSHMSELFPGFASTQVIRAFAGTVELTVDHLPLFGAAPAAEGLWVSAGYNGHGFGLGAAMGRLSVELLRAGRRTDTVPPVVAALLERFRPDRFIDHKELQSA